MSFRVRPTYTRDGSAEWKNTAMSTADPIASAAVNPMIPHRRPRVSRTMSTNASGHTRYHCSSMPSDHVCRSGDGVASLAKYDDSNS
jgi:hypothetical protein